MKRLKKHCKDCPVFYMESDNKGLIQAVEGGCLPDFFEMYKWYQDTGKVWACHAKNTCQCQGFVEFSKEYKNIDIPEEAELITESRTLEQIYNK